MTEALRPPFVDRHQLVRAYAIQKSRHHLADAITVLAKLTEPSDEAAGALCSAARVSSLVDPSRYTGTPHTRHVLKVDATLAALDRLVGALGKRRVKTWGDGPQVPPVDDVSHALMDAAVSVMSGAVPSYRYVVYRMSDASRASDEARTADASINTSLQLACKAYAALDAGTEQAMWGEGCGTVDFYVIHLHGLLALLLDQIQTEVPELAEVVASRITRLSEIKKSHARHLLHLISVRCWNTERGDILAWGEENGGVHPEAARYFYKEFWDKLFKIAAVSSD